MSFSMKAIGAMALFGAALFQETASQLTDCAASSSAGFDYEVTLGSDVDVRWSVDVTAETISFEVFSPAAAWVGLGFSADGMMIGSDAVIGLPDNSTISEYDMTGKEVDLVTLYDDQEITDAGVTQDTTGTTITFTRPLTPATTGKEVLSSTPGDETWLVYAFGTDNTLAYHGTGDNRGDALLDLFCGDTTVVATVSPSPAATATAEPSAAATSVVATFAPLAEGQTGAPTIVATTLTPLAAGATAAPTIESGSGSDGDRGVTTTDAPTAAVDDRSEAPSGGEDDDGADGTSEGNFAFRVGGGGGVWVAVASTVSAAVLGAAMAV